MIFAACLTTEDDVGTFNEAVSVLEMVELKAVDLPRGFEKGTDVKGQLVIVDGITDLNVIPIMFKHGVLELCVIPCADPHFTFPRKGECLVRILRQVKGCVIHARNNIVGKRARYQTERKMSYGCNKSRGRLRSSDEKLH